MKEHIVTIVISIFTIVVLPLLYYYLKRFVSVRFGKKLIMSNLGLYSFWGTAYYPDGNSDVVCIQNCLVDIDCCITNDSDTESKYNYKIIIKDYHEIDEDKLTFIPPEIGDGPSDKNYFYCSINGLEKVYPCIVISSQDYEENGTIKPLNHHDIMIEGNSFNSDHILLNLQKFGYYLLELQMEYVRRNNHYKEIRTISFLNVKTDLNEISQKYWEEANNKT